ncbi:MAG: trypsin-like peptidase domain-containing protein [Gallionellaceae bacterium]|jgi:S1-C subfamily serine protease|nr:trypsin-like peptidase domain-containing protein [Gallionellaceae bacterium]
MTNSITSSRLACALLAILCLFSSAAHAADPAPRAVTPRGELGAEEKATIALFEKSRDSVVFIDTRTEVRDFWTRNVFSVPRGSGSGFIWDEGGHIITNYHVIAGASEAVVRMSDGKDYKARLVGVSPIHDIAVLSINLAQKQSLPLPIGVSHDLRVGQKVFAIGNPFGLDWTLTSGIVSALDRSLVEENGVTVEHLIQTDAAINPGNSGGPLLDSAGRLIGINTAIYSPSGANAGIGFAVPVDTVNRVVPELIRYGKYTYPSLGVEIDESINTRLKRGLGISGVVILRVPAGSTAAAAGLIGITSQRGGRITVGDVILAIENKPVDSVSKLAARLDDFKVGDSVRLTVQREGKKREVRITLEAGKG